MKVSMNDLSLKITLSKFNAFSILTNHVSHAVAVTWILRSDSKTSMNFFLPQFNRFVLPVDISDLSIQFFSY